MAVRVRRRWIAAAVTMLLAFSALVYLDEEHSFDLRTEQLMFESGGNLLDGRIHLPVSSEGRHGVVFFVPGDGPWEPESPIDAVWEALTEAGYAVVEWNKPGVGDSTGNWLDQNMQDRANEVADAVDALANRPDLDLSRIGVIGVSQGGWVLPLVADSIDADFYIAWSTAIDWQEQGAYLTERSLVTTEADADLAARVRLANRSDRGSTYQEYLQWHASLDTDVAEYFSEMTQERWQFVERNKDLDARSTLPNLRDTPVLLLLGGDDDNVDVLNTEEVYEAILGGPCLQVVHYPGADHNLLDHEGVGLTITGIFRPRSIFAEGLLEDIGTFARDHEGCGQ